MRIYGLTGGIASGKSEAARIFAELGAAVIDADQVGHEVMGKGRPAYLSVVDEFGEGVLDRDGEIDRPRLRELIFTDPDAKEKLERITHPPIIGAIAGRIREHFEKENTPAIIEAALLIESGQPFPLNGVIVVYASERKQIKRLCRRDGVDVRQARAALAAQMPMREKVRLADYIIRNNGSIRALRGRVKKVWDRILAEG